MLNKLSNKLSSIINYLYFSIYTLRYNIKLGCKFCIHGKLDFRVYKTSVLEIGDNFYFSNARKLNPNLSKCSWLCTDRKESRIDYR